jgi:hypothetical protein
MPEPCHGSIVLETQPAALTSTETTLYELIETINDIVGPGEDRLTCKTVLHLIDSGKIRIAGDLDW